MIRQVAYQLWCLSCEDLKLCIGETMLFCRRLFGDAASSWAALSDGTATMTLEEWQEAWDTLGYFGPVAQVFAFLDKDGSGGCSSTAFEQLSKYEVSNLGTKLD